MSAQLILHLKHKMPFCRLILDLTVNTLDGDPICWGYQEHCCVNVQVLLILVSIITRNCIKKNKNRFLGTYSFVGKYAGVSSLLLMISLHLSRVWKTVKVSPML